jgi:membrane associated rhomboid family serine protease
MIPLRDSIPSRSTPYVSYAIIGACVIIQALQLLSPTRLVEWAVVPQQFVNPAAWRDPGIGHILATLLTGQFLHADFLHLGFNMLFLWVFGDNVEDRMGHGRYLIFYLLCGIVAFVAQSALSWFPKIPMLGASGAIAGVLGAYFVLFKTAWIRSIIIILFFPIFVDIPALVFIGIWFVIQALNALYTVGRIPASGNAGIAFAAHAVGFLVGILLLRVFSPPGRHPKVRVVRWEVD